jgi:hypothetical protein
MLQGEVQEPRIRSHAERIFAQSEKLMIHLKKSPRRNNARSQSTRQPNSLRITFAVMLDWTIPSTISLTGSRNSSRFWTTISGDGLVASSPASYGVWPYGWIMWRKPGTRANRVSWIGGAGNELDLRQPRAGV